MRPNKLQLTEEDIQSLIKAYNEGASLVKLGKELSCAPETVGKILKKRGVKIINRQNAINFDIEKDVLPLLEKGMSLTQIAKIVHNSRQSLALHMRKHGYIVVNKQNETKFNEKIFDCIDTEEKAYWLGFLYADGNLSKIEENKKQRYTVELALALCDIDHLKKFQTFLGFNHDRIKISSVKLNDKEYYRCRLMFGNKHVWTVLNNYGCTPQKSLTLKFPNDDIFCGDKERLIISFIKGYFDGDGSLSYTLINSKNSKNYSPLAYVLGTKDFLNCVSLKLFKHEKHLKLENVNCPNSGQQTYGLGFSVSETQRLLHLFYENSAIHLDRKYKRAMFFIDRRPTTEELNLFLQEELNEKLQPQKKYLKNIEKCNTMI